MNDGHFKHVNEVEGVEKCGRLLGSCTDILHLSYHSSYLISHIEPHSR